MVPRPLPVLALSMPAVHCCCESDLRDGSVREGKPHSQCLHSAITTDLKKGCGYFALAAWSVRLPILWWPFLASWSQRMGVSLSLAGLMVFHFSVRNYLSF